MSPLTRAEAGERSHRLRVHRAFVEFDLRAPESFRSTTRIEFGTVGPKAPAFVEFRPRTLLRAELNGQEIDPGLLADGRLPILPATDNVLVLTGDMAYSNDGEGLHRHVDPADGRSYLYAMSFLDAAPRWFACFDQPDLKCPYAMRVRAPRDWTVLGNGRLTEVEPGHWEMGETPPLASYFVTLVAGPYASTFDEHEGIRLGLHARASLATELSTQADDIFRVTKQGFTAYHDLFAEPYAFGDYHQAFVPDFNAGAMENPGCVTFRDAYLFRGQVTRAERAGRAGTIVHELAHQWFGDLVTMRWWDELWLNESFAEYIAHEVCAEHTDYPLWVDFGLNRKDWGSIADQGPTTHPVAGNGAQDTEAALASFDGISYAKGAGVLKQLVARVTPEVFRAGLRDHIAAHRFGTADFDDLRAALEGAGAGDLESWSRAWLLTAGMDTLTACPDGNQARIGRTPGFAPACGGGGGSPEDRPASEEMVREHTVRLVALDAGGQEVGRWPVRVPAGGGTRESVPRWARDAPPPRDWSERVGEVPPGGLLVPDGADDTWARIRPDRPVEQWPPLSSVADPLTRVVLWNSIRDQVRAAELDPAAALDVLCDQLPAEPEDLIIRTVVDWGQKALCGPFSRAEDRRHRLGRLAATVDRILEGSEPGADLQLSAWHALMGCTDDARALRGWLDGTDLPASRALDPELRWRVATRLAALTGDRAVIEETYARDRSTAGRVHRARALAGLPDPEAKEEAFAQLMEPGELSAYELYALADGFFSPEQAEVTEPFVRRFFAGINATAAFRSGWALGQIVLRAFPVSSNTRATLELAEDLLATDGLAPGVRQPLLEATDLLRRAVVSVERFGGHGPSRPR